MCQVRKGTETCGGIEGKAGSLAVKVKAESLNKILWVPVSHTEPEPCCQDESGFRWLLSFREVHGSNKTGWDLGREAYWRRIMRALQSQQCRGWGGAGGADESKNSARLGGIPEPPQVWGPCQVCNWGR